MKQLKSFIHAHSLVIIILLVLSLPALVSLVHPGFLQTDDGNWMIIRFSAFYQALRDGQFPVRWLGRLNQGFGYPVADFLYPGFLYLGIPLQILTSNVVMTVKLLFGLSLFASSVGMYLWLSSRFDRFSSAVGALVYLYTPYHLYDMTQRGSLGEVLALAVVPFVFWALERGSWIIFSLTFALLILSHNTLAVMFTPVITLYAGMLVWSDQVKIRHFLGSFLLGIGLSAFFWLPALFDLRYTVFHQTVISDWQQYFAGLSLIGWGTLAIAFSAILLLFLQKNRIKIQLWLLLSFFLAVVVGSLFLSTAASSFLWKILPVQFVQFPFRFLSLTVLATAYLSAWVVEKKVLAGIVLSILVFLSCLPYLQSESYQLHDSGYFDTNEATTTVKNEYMPVWVRQLPTTHASDLVASTHMIVTGASKSSHHFAFTLMAPKQTPVMINQLYFPGWEVFVDGRKTDVHPSNPQGLLSFSLSKGQHQIIGRFGETPFRFFADILSLLSVILVVVFSLTQKKFYAKT
jgi:hypothetical protein